MLRRSAASSQHTPRVAGRTRMIPEQMSQSRLDLWPHHCMPSRSTQAASTTSLSLATYNLCGFPEDSLYTLEELLSSCQFCFLQEVVRNTLQTQEAYLHYSFPHSQVILGGWRLGRLSGMLLANKFYSYVRSMHSWNYGVYIDIAWPSDATVFRMVSLHLPDSWKDISLFQSALQDLEHVISSAPSSQVILAGDLNTEMLTCTDHLLVGDACTEANTPDTCLRSRLLYAVLDRHNIILGSTFREGLRYDRSTFATYAHWTTGRSKCLDYIAASRSLFRFTTDSRSNSMNTWLRIDSQQDLSGPARRSYNF
mmetsp:Transcript_6845/g.14948  ORF Transcript_6845/g.14948 Transcript_6845/m.14948 type:complete len:310 (-) Transcript_6845:103-1032(-)